MYKHLINNLISADDLHWCEEDQKYVSLSYDETQDIITGCLSQGMTDLSEIYKVINWCGSVRVGQILWKNFLSGSIKIVGFDGDEPRFSVNKEN